MNFKVGDKVKVKSLSELKKLFKKNATIDCMGDWDYEYKLSNGTCEDIYFVTGMKNTCEKTATVKHVEENDETYELEFEDISCNDYLFIDDWLEPSIEPIYVSSFDDEVGNKSEKLKAILAQMEQLLTEARKIAEE